MNVVFRDFNKRDFTEFESLAYRAIFERGYVDIDFNKQHWNLNLKNLVSLNSNIIRLVYIQDQMVGFYIIQLHTLPWNHRTQALFQLMHLEGQHRNSAVYHLMFRDAERVCEDNRVEKIQTTDTAILMEEHERLTLLHNHNYYQIDGVWEVKKDV